MKTVPRYVAFWSAVAGVVVAHPFGRVLDAMFASLGVFQGAGWWCFAVGVSVTAWMWNDEMPRWRVLAVVNLMCAGCVLWGIGGGAWQRAGADATTFTIIYAVMWFASVKWLALMFFAKWEMPQDVRRRWRDEGRIA